MNSAGYREIEHTADWELEVWAPDFPSLLAQAARGMYSLAGTRLAPQPRTTRTLTLAGTDGETTLVSFLNELVWLGESEGLGFDQFEITRDGDRISALLSGAEIESQSKEIKAVTYHRLLIRKSRRGLEVNIVFDV